MAEKIINIIDKMKTNHINKIGTFNVMDDLEEINGLEGSGKKLIDQLEDRKKEFKDCWAIYIFKIKDGFKFDGKVLKKYENAKKKCQMARCPNEDALPKESEILYVGSSQHLYTRLKQHLTDKYKSVYALHLSTWFPKDKSINIQIIEMKDKNAEKMQFYEDMLWEAYKPILGKKGTK